MNQVKVIKRVPVEGSHTLSDVRLGEFFRYLELGGDLADDSRFKIDQISNTPAAYTHLKTGQYGTMAGLSEYQVEILGEGSQIVIQVGPREHQS